MADSARAEIAPLALALGRVPSGLFILTVSHGGRSTGMLASWVQQAGFEPPMVTAAIRADRYVGDWVRESGRFALSQIAARQKALIRHFARGFEPDAEAFQGLGLRDDALGGPVLADALAYLDVEVAGVCQGGDHNVLLGRVVGGAMLQPGGEPMLHVRHNGMHY